MNNWQNNGTGRPGINGLSNSSGRSALTSSLASHEILQLLSQQRPVPAASCSVRSQQPSLQTSRRLDRLQQEVQQHLLIQNQLQIQKELLHRQLQLTHQRELIQQQQLLRTKLRRLALPQPPEDAAIAPSIDPIKQSGNKRKAVHDGSRDATVEPRPRRRPGGKSKADKPEHDRMVKSLARGLVQDKELLRSVFGYCTDKPSGHLRYSLKRLMKKDKALVAVMKRDNRKNGRLAASALEALDRLIPSRDDKEHAQENNSPPVEHDLSCSNDENEHASATRDDQRVEENNAPSTKDERSFSRDENECINAILLLQNNGSVTE